MRSLYLLSLICIVASLQGCTNVEPWERSYLAKNEMQLDPYPLDSKFRRHMYFSREATPGGTGSVGSCGCN